VLDHQNVSDYISLEGNLNMNFAISQAINWPLGHAKLKSPTQQQILEICACCGDYNCGLPTEVLQLLVRRIIVIAHKMMFIGPFFH